MRATAVLAVASLAMVIGCGSGDGSSTNGAAMATGGSFGASGGSTAAGGVGAGGTSGGGGPASGGVTAPGGAGSGGTPSGGSGGAAGGSGGAAGGSGGAAGGSGGAADGSGGAAGGGGPSSDAGPSTGGMDGSGGAPAGRMGAGVNVHNYPKPTAYGFVAADGKDRMGAALTGLSVRFVRGATLGDTTFLARLHDFGVTEVILGLTANAHGKPFDPATVAPALEKSLAAASALGMTVQVEGLNEWDLFHSRPYNAGVLPPGMTDAEFVAFTQQALYDAAHPLGVRVIGPSIGHPTDASSQAYFPDVSAAVDIVNAHMYFTSNPEGLDLPALVAIHTRFQGTGKPVWVTETGIASYASVSLAGQADVIRRGLALYAASGLIDRLFDYELLDGHLVGWDGTAFNVDTAEYHFGLYAYDGSEKPSAAPFREYLSTP